MAFLADALSGIGDVLSMPRRLLYQHLISPLMGEDVEGFGDVLGKAGMDEGGLRSILGFLGDMGTDPLNWAGLAAFKGIGAARKAARFSAGLPEEAAAATRAVGEGGEPLRVFHGATNPNPANALPKNAAADNLGHFFTESPDVASQYAEGLGGNVKSAFLDMRNPLQATVDTPYNQETASELLQALGGKGGRLREAIGKAGVEQPSMSDIFHSFRMDAGSAEQSLLRKLGYDAVVGTEGGAREFAMLDPSKIYAPWLAKGKPNLPSYSPLAAALAGSNVLSNTR